jgi:hypothetical protein
MTMRRGSPRPGAGRAPRCVQASARRRGLLERAHEDGAGHDEEHRHRPHLERRSARNASMCGFAVPASAIAAVSAASWPARRRAPPRAHEQRRRHDAHHEDGRRPWAPARRRDAARCRRSWPTIISATKTDGAGGGAAAVDPPAREADRRSNQRHRYRQRGPADDRQHDRHQERQRRDREQHPRQPSVDCASRTGSAASTAPSHARPRSQRLVAGRSAGSKGKRGVIAEKTPAESGRRGRIIGAAIGGGGQGGTAPCPAGAL